MAKKSIKTKKGSPRYVYTGHEEFPKTNIKLTCQELEILFQHPPELMKLYIFLSLYRDFDTNITGQSVHIDDASFKLWVGYTSKPGRKGWKPSTTHIVRWLEQLEGLGLIKRLGNNVFFLPLAHKKQHDQNISHQAVTNLSPNTSEGVTKTYLQENDVLISKNRDGIKAHVNEVSPNNKTGVTDLSQRLYTIPDINLTKLNYTETANILSTEENKFINLFTDLKLYVGMPLDLKAITTAKALIKHGVTLEEAADALKIKLAAYKGSRTPHPSYFKDAILDYKKDLESIKQEPTQLPQEEKAHAPTTARPAQQFRSVAERVQAELDQLPDEWPEEEEEVT